MLDVEAKNVVGECWLGTEKQSKQDKQSGANFPSQFTAARRFLPRDVPARQIYRITVFFFFIFFITTFFSSSSSSSSHEINAILITTMAPSKQITVTPRYLLPRLTWNGTPRITITAIQGAPISTNRPQAHNNNRVDDYHAPSRKFNISTDPVRNHSLPSSIRFLSTTPSQPPTTTNTSPSTPIRHNGVYVATFNPARRAFHASAIMSRDHHFDTLKFVQRLKNEGFSEEQAVAMMKVLNDVIQESIQNLTRTMVLREGM